MIIIDGIKYIEKSTDDLPFGNACRHCAFYKTACYNRTDFSCHSDERDDGAGVVFIKPPQIQEHYATDVRLLAMIFQPKIGQEAIINYKDKAMPWQGVDCEIITVGLGPGPRNVLVETAEDCVVIPRGNLVAI